MMMFRNVLVLSMVSSVLFASTAHAQALAAPIEDLVINRAEAAIISRVAAARGFAANDPRIAATFAAMSEASTGLNVASTGAGAAVAMAGAPVWLTVAVGLGVLAAGSALVMGSVTLLRSSDGGTISVTQPTPALPAYTGPLYQSSSSGALSAFDYGRSIGMQAYRTDSCQSGDSQCSQFPALPTSSQGLNFVRNFVTTALVASSADVVQNYRTYEVSLNCKTSNSLPESCQALSSLRVYWRSNANGTSSTLYEDRVEQDVGNDGTSAVVPVSVSQPMTNYYWTTGAGVAPVSGTDLSTIYPQLLSSATGQPLDPNTVAVITNQTWQQAASEPGYQGLPYSASSPISSQDAGEWLLANPTAAPTIGDLFTPASDPGSQIVTISPTVSPGTSGATSTSPGSNTGTSSSSGSDVNVVNTPSVNVVNKVSVDLGSDPGVASPGLETTPTISMILSPILNLLPDLKSWVVPSHSEACPEPSFSVFGRSFTLSAQCDLAEQNRSGIYASFAAMFTIAALFIVLSA